MISSLYMLEIIIRDIDLEYKIITTYMYGELGDIIRSCDIYITATQNEPGAIQYLEGLSCGLPVLYSRGGGGAAEICNISGEEYTDISSMLVGLDKIRKIIKVCPKNTI